MTVAPRTVRHVLPAALLVLATAGCAEGGAGPGGTAEASCAPSGASAASGASDASAASAGPSSRMW
ncbi:hypothetical protein OIA45_28765 [Streptomyces chartreusis]|uniref:hypothetical protein n=1 Tax=Streptomyces chartreusis TaxID=1969 RepID=UPI003863FB43|nr:hypothetical protein OIA45_28765 [Streptomyces chartreusis]